jgi:hypothetical protein
VLPVAGGVLLALGEPDVLPLAGGPLEPAEPAVPGADVWALSPGVTDEAGGQP